MPRRRFSMLVLGAGLLLGLAGSVRPEGLPTLATISVDGDSSDWQLVLQNPVNLTLDGDGSTVDCADSTDRDCRVGKEGRDIRRFAWTWDDRAFAVYFSRQADLGQTDSFYVYLDEDLDGLMQTGESVLELIAQEIGLGLNEIRIKTYVAVDPGGDKLVDTDGLADGHDMPGSVSGPPRNIPGGLAVSADGIELEAAVPWLDLGLQPGTPFNLHVAGASGADLPANLDDNAGGPDGRAATTAFPALVLEPGVEVGTGLGMPVRLAHRVENIGTVADRILVQGVSSCGLDTDYWLDLDANGIDDVYLGHDAGGDGLFTDPSDSLGPAGDSDSDGRLDLGQLGAGEFTVLALHQDYPTDPTVPTCRMDIGVEFLNEPSVSDRAVDLIHGGELTLTPEAMDRPVSAGESSWIPLLLLNASGGMQTLDLSCWNGFSWGCLLFSDPDGDGDPADAVALSDSDASGEVDLTLADGESAPLLVRVIVPSAAPVGQTNALIVRVSLGGVVGDFSSVQLVVRPSVELVPNHLGDDGNEHHGPPGGAVFFPHRIINALGTPDGFTLSSSSPQGWPVAFLSDPDGDGKPYDSSPLLPGEATAPGGGGHFDFIARVDLPLAAAPSTSDRVTITATSLSDPSSSDWAVDDAFVSIVTVHDDQARTVSLAEALPCQTIHAMASGLPALVPGHRFVWRSPSGTVARIRAFTTDAAGRGYDEWGADPFDVGGWTLELEEEIGINWVLLDTVPFDVEDPLSIGGLATDEAGYDVRDTVLAASAELTNDSLSLLPTDITLRWVVLSPDGSLYLDAASGAFLPYSGVEATRAASWADVPRGSTESTSLVVASVSYPEEGSHAIELWLSYPCGAERLGESSVFDVLDDEDGDGLSRADEIAAGTDPTDADSDDDGLLDGADGVSDSDGDGFLDALDCDSDEDGLSDGLEAGVLLPHDDTDVAAGCFLPDADSASTSDPDDPDTDGGGVPDGIEDTNRDGREDAGEGDPRDPTDDAGLCAAAVPPEVADLRLARQGSAALLSWAPVLGDPCLSYTVLSSEALPVFAEQASGLRVPTELDATSLGAAVRYYLIRADSLTAGPGPTGR